MQIIRSSMFKKKGDNNMIENEEIDKIKELDESVKKDLMEMVLYGWH